MPIPAALIDGAGSTRAGAKWVARLPRLVARAAQRWGLRLDAPYGVGTAAWTAPGTTADGTPIVLKITFPHDEAMYEARALTLWQGHAAVELLAHDEGDWALLLRRAHPGTLLLDDPSPGEARLEVCLQLLRSLHTANTTGTDLPHLSAVSARWHTLARERANRWASLLSGEIDIVEVGIALLGHFSQPDPHMPNVVLHGDLNPGNVLLDTPSGKWLAIDPKPMLGEAAYDLWPSLSQIGDPFRQPPAVLAARTAHAAQMLGIPFVRICDWAVARTVESVLWQLDTWSESARRTHALSQLHHARTWAAIGASART